LVGSLLVAGCGTALSHDKIVAAAGGSGSDLGGGGGTGGTGSGTGSAAGSGDGASSSATGSTLAGATGGGAGGGGGSATGSGGSGGGGGGGPANATGSGGKACTGTASTIVLGNIGSFSGLAGAALPGSQQAVQAWSQWVNAKGGLNCHPVKLVSADDGGDPARALSLAKQMVESQGAVAFVGNMIPLSLSGIQPYIEQKHIPMVGGDVSLPQWTQSPMIFPSGTDADSFRAAQGREFVKAGFHKLAILYCGETPSCTQGAKYLQDHPTPGLDIVYSAQISIAQTNFTTECLQAKSKGATALYVASEGNSLIRIARDCTQQGFHPQYTAASIAVLPEMASDSNLSGLLALIGNAPWFATSVPGVAEYRQAMARYAPNAPLTAAGLAAFTSGVMLQHAAANVGAKPTASDIVAGLDAMKGYTADGLAPPLTFHAGQGSGAVPCYFLIQIKGGQWTAPNGTGPKC
jgi:branched-chain amino acid transport system substrate-binding protein